MLITTICYIFFDTVNGSKSNTPSLTADLCTVHSMSIPSSIPLLLSVVVAIFESENGSSDSYSVSPTLKNNGHDVPIAVELSDFLYFMKAPPA